MNFHFETHVGDWHRIDKLNIKKVGPQAWLDLLAGTPTIPNFKNFLSLHIFAKSLARQKHAFENF